MKLREQYLNNGFVIIKNFFDKDELNSQKKNFSNVSNNFDHEIFDNDFIQKLYLNEQFFNLIKKILGTEKLIYFSDSSIVKHKDVFSPSNGYHNDSRRDNYNFLNEYPLLRVATYLQESIKNSGGIKIKPGSHKYFCLALRGFKQKLITMLKKIIFFDKNFRFKLLSKGIQPPLDLGDLIIWNLRTHHSGTAIKFKFLNNLSLHPLIEKLLPNIIKLPCKDRMAVFMVFGNDLPNEKNLEKYVNDKNSKQQFNYDNIESLKSKFSQHNIRFISSKKI